MIDRTIDFWEADDSLWFCSATQGSNLLPYDFFLELEQLNSQALFRSPENINNFRYLVQKPTCSNPDGLPVGMAGITAQADGQILPALSKQERSDLLEYLRSL